MKHYIILICICTACTLASIGSYALVTSDVVISGAWSAGSSWDIGVPVCGDSILVVSGDIIELATQQDYSACGVPMVLIIDGTLRFPANGPKLKLPAGSMIIVNTGGLITAPGGGNGNKISIGTEWVWEKLDGDVNGYACFGGCGPLPVSLQSIELISNEKSICIRWVTLTESNNNYFTVERSVDGMNFSKIVEVKGAGNSNSKIKYEVKDWEPLNGVSYYRLRQTDFDGQYSFSETLSIEVYFSNNQAVTIFPNPLLRGDNLMLTVDGLRVSDVILIQLQNISSRSYLIQNFVASVDGTQTFTLHTAGNLESGLFLVTVITEQNTSTGKLLVY